MNLIIATTADMPPPLPPVLATRRPGTTRQGEYTPWEIIPMDIDPEWERQWREYWEYAERVKRDAGVTA